MQSKCHVNQRKKVNRPVCNLIAQSLTLSVVQQKHYEGCLFMMMQKDENWLRLIYEIQTCGS